MAVETTFQVTQQLLKESLDTNTSLSSVVKTALKNRIDALPRDEARVLGVNEVESTQGSVTTDIPNGSVEVAIGALGTNRVEFDEQTFASPVTIRGSEGSPFGLLLGNTGESVNPAVATADITAQYRLSSTDTWKAWTRSTLIESTKTVQFAVNIADQVADSALPQLWFVAEQL